MAESLVVAIGGPTASGKSETAIWLAKKINAEIISADVMQSYRQLDIGTAKINIDDMQGIAHYMIDEFSPYENVDISTYTKRALKYEQEVIQKNKAPIITGGSGLYLDSIIYDSYTYEENTASSEIRQELETLYKQKGGSYMYAFLESCDPEYAEITHPNNINRIIRALEYYKVSGRKKSDNLKIKKLRYNNTFYFAVSMDRNNLYERINKRVDIMVEKGLIEEVKRLIDMGVSLSYNAMKAIGYKEIASALLNNTDIDDAVELVKQKSRNYAKRQMTWFNANKDIIWIKEDKPFRMAERIAGIINERK